MKRTIGLGGVLALGATVLLSTPALAADTKVLHVSDVDFSETQTGGHYEVVDGELRRHAGPPDEMSPPSPSLSAALDS